MSKQLPKKLIRKYREFQDRIIGYSGQPAIFYRYEGENDPSQTTNNPADEFLEDHHLTNTRNIYEGPIQTEVKINWPEDLKITRDGQLNVDESDSIPARMKFSDHPTIESYLKTPWVTALDVDNIDENAYESLGEEQKVIRLEIVNIKATGEDQDSMVDIQLNIKRTNQNLHPDDNSPLDHINLNDFFI